MAENSDTQKIKINSITFKQHDTLSKEFYQDKYFLDILVNQKFAEKSSTIKINKFYETYDIDLEISFNEQLDSILFKFCNEKIIYLYIREHSLHYLVI